MADALKLLRAVINSRVNIPFPGADLAQSVNDINTLFPDAEPLVIPFANISAPEGNDIYYPLTLGGIRLQGEPQISVSFNKQIVKSVPVGGLSKRRKGSVKELMAEDDATINISGFLFNDEEYGLPTDELFELYELYQRGERLDIRHDILNEADITGVVIENMSWPHYEVQNGIRYEIQCISDEEQEFKFVSDGPVGV